jgi:putative hydroxymethylpyrimidine transport system substrate-binding protein
MKRTSVLIIGVLTFAMSACGEKKDTLQPSGAPQHLTLMLDWFPNADHVGIYRALAEGDFKRANLDVRVQTPSDPATPLQLLAAGKVDAAISYEPEVLLARDRGQPLVSVAALVQKPLTSIISVGKKRVNRPSDLRGKRVGNAGISYQHAYLSTILARAGVQPNTVKEINVGSNLVPAMVSGRVDATLGGYWNYEAIQLSQQRKRPSVLRVDRLGVPSYDELVVVVRKSSLTNRQTGDQLRRFVQVLARGYQAARSSPQASVGSLVAANPGLDRKLQLASVQATLPVFFPGGGRPWGWQSPTQWNVYGQWMLSHHLITNPQALVDASTNELLAGQGP